MVLPYWSDLGSMNPHDLGDQSRFVWRMISFSSDANVAWNSGFCLDTSSHSHRTYPPDPIFVHLLFSYVFLLGIA